MNTAIQALSPQLTSQPVQRGVLLAKANRRLYLSINPSGNAVAEQLCLRSMVGLLALV
jgi:hypothetical protein